MLLYSSVFLCVALLSLASPQETLKRRDGGFPSVFDKRAVPTCSNATEKAFIAASYDEAKTLARAAIDYIKTQGTDSDIYTDYFMGRSPATLSTSFNPSLRCDETTACAFQHRGSVAWTDPNTNIFYCPVFFQKVPTSDLCVKNATVDSRSVRGGTTLHELTHAVNNTDDVIYGCQYSRLLRYPYTLKNAENFNCFATQVYKTMGCPKY